NDRGRRRALQPSLRLACRRPRVPGLPPVVQPRREPGDAAFHRARHPAAARGPGLPAGGKYVLDGRNDRGSEVALSEDGPHAVPSHEDELVTVHPRNNPGRLAETIKGRIRLLDDVYVDPRLH